MVEKEGVDLCCFLKWRRRVDMVKERRLGGGVG
jgi:hypothetical protein